ncbi:50S ribosomal protein L25 [Buchnera aphidicola]|uniref:50S ribosomal protein L25 n=1 Tax=Buchnera aphidicola TaxID=9 RepID=UPI002237CEBF|nr:50S ribosomal protein L25 [Buchnera aphidicola]MCW5197636.1 50S ribosomal protein L25 [Buchnera aphidicola (Chaitophorus viminalis)]
MINIYARKRYFHGTQNSRKLRLKNYFPSIIYGKNKQSLLIQLKQDEILNLLNKNNLKNNNFFIVIKDKKINVKLKEIQRHPFKHKFIHIDFLRI